MTSDPVVYNLGTSGDDYSVPVLGLRNDDTLGGGAGDDRVAGKRGDDVLIYNVETNEGSSDLYDGGIGFDTLRIVMTKASWLDQDIQDDIAAYLDFLNAETQGGTQDAAKVFFKFSAFDLRITRMENLEIFVDGVSVTPGDDPAIANDDAIDVNEESPIVFGNVLTNDSVPDLVAQVDVVTGPTYGSLVLNDDGSFSYDLDNTDPAVQSLGALDQLTDTFVYMVTDADGDTDIATATITINGENDVPIVGGDATGSVAEDGVQSDGGILTITDPDTGQSSFMTQSNTAGTYGTFSVDAAGNWSYALNNLSAAVQDLNSSDTVFDTFSVQSSDGSNSIDVSVQVNGTDDIVLQQEVIDFNDGNVLGEYSVTSYKGFAISATGSHYNTFSNGLLPVQYDSDDADLEAYNGWAHKYLDITRIDGDDFNFVSAYFADGAVENYYANGDANELTVRGFDDGVEVLTTVVTLNENTMTKTDFNYQSIDRLLVEVTGGLNSGNGVVDTGWYAVDDMLFEV